MAGERRVALELPEAHRAAIIRERPRLTEGRVQEGEQIGSAAALAYNQVRNAFGQQPTI
jgi:hypothetical protein